MNYKKQSIFWIVLIMLNLIAIGLFLIVFSGKRDYSANQKRNSYLIGASYMTMNNEFYEIMSEEIKARVEVEGDRWVLRDPALSPERQIRQIEEMLEMGIDVLVLAPVDWTSLTSVLERAREQGVWIVVVDTDVADKELVDCTITSDNYLAGALVGEYFLSRHDEAKVLVMTHEAARSGQNRVQGFCDTVSKKEGIEIVRKIECEGQLEIAMPKLQEVIAEGVEFDSLFCLNDLAGVGAVAALEEHQMLEQVEVYGVDASPDSKGLIKEGMMEATAAQFPSKIGKTAADVIYSLLNGEETESHILVPVELITSDNVEDFGIDRWQ